MSFREKILWTTLLVGLAPYIWYFGEIALNLAGNGGVDALSLNRLIGVMLWGTLVLIIAVVVIAIRNKGEGSMIPDERESVIERRGIFFSYHLLCSGVLAVILASWLGWSQLAALHLLLVFFVSAEFSRVAIEIVGLRRGY